MKTIALIAVAALAACASDGLSEDGLLAQAPVVNRAESVDGEGMGEEEARQALAAAEEAYLRGDDRECLRIVREALDRSPPESVAVELRSLRMSARRRLLTREVVEARAIPRRDVVTVGTDIEVDLAVRNLADVVVEVAESDGGASDSLFVVDILRRDVDIYGNAKVETERVLLPLGADLVLPVGGRAAVTHTVSTGRAEDRHLGITEFRISGTLRPAVIRAGEDRYYEAVTLRDAVVRVLPPGWEPIAADALGTLRKALSLGAREHLLVAAELMPPESTRSAAEALVDALRTGVSPEMERTVLASLERLTGVAFGGDAAAVEKWRSEGGLDGIR